MGGPPLFIPFSLAIAGAAGFHGPKGAGAVYLRRPSSLIRAR